MKRSQINYPVIYKKPELMSESKMQNAIVPGQCCASRIRLYYQVCVLKGCSRSSFVYQSRIMLCTSLRLVHFSNCRHTLLSISYLLVLYSLPGLSLLDQTDLQADRINSFSTRYCMSEWGAFNSRGDESI